MSISSAGYEGDQNRVLQVTIADRLDATAQARLEAVARQAAEERPDRVVIDLAACTGADAAGIDALLAVHRAQWRSGRRLTLRSVPDRVTRLLALARLDHVFETEPA